MPIPRRLGMQLGTMAALVGIAVALYSSWSLDRALFLHFTRGSSAHVGPYSAHLPLSWYLGDSIPGQHTQFLLSPAAPGNPDSHAMLEFTPDTRFTQPFAASNWQQTMLSVLASKRPNARFEAETVPATGLTFYCVRADAQPPWEVELHCKADVEGLTFSYDGTRKRLSQARAILASVQKG